MFAVGIGSSAAFDQGGEESLVGECHLCLPHAHHDGGHMGSGGGDGQVGVVGHNREVCDVQHLCFDGFHNVVIGEFCGQISSERSDFHGHAVSDAFFVSCQMPGGSIFDPLDGVFGAFSPSGSVLLQSFDLMSADVLEVDTAIFSHCVGNSQAELGIVRPMSGFPVTEPLVADGCLVGGDPAFFFRDCLQRPGFDGHSQGITDGDAEKHSEGFVFGDHGFGSLWFGCLRCL